MLPGSQEAIKEVTQQKELPLGFPGAEGVRLLSQESVPQWVFKDRKGKPYL